jgi:hypothetical protein
MTQRKEAHPIVRSSVSEMLLITMNKRMHHQQTATARRQMIW